MFNVRNTRLNVTAYRTSGEVDSAAPIGRENIGITVSERAFTIRVRYR